MEKRPYREIIVSLLILQLFSKFFLFMIFMEIEPIVYRIL